MNPEILLKLAKYKMPFGKYKDRLLMEIPEEYLIWFQGKGFPKGELGELLALTYEIKLNGLEYLIDNLN
jgi:uncharacterized protein (DUF3820 family)